MSDNHIKFQTQYPTISQSFPEAQKYVSILLCDEAVVWKASERWALLNESRLSMERPLVRSSLSRNISYLHLLLNRTPRDSFFSCIRVHHGHFPCKHWYFQEEQQAGGSHFWRYGLGYQKATLLHGELTTLHQGTKKGNARFG